MDGVKKFFQEKKMDWKFRKAGGGHRLDEEKPKPTQSKPGPSQPVRPPSDASKTSGSAAIARLEGQNQRKPLSAGSQPMKKKERDSGGVASSTGAGAHIQTPPSSHGSGSGDHAENWHEGGRKLDSRLTQGSPSISDSQQEPVVSVVDVASKTIIVHMICPLCKRSTPHGTLREHFASCLQEEYLKEPLSASVHMIHTLCTDQDKRKLCIDTLCRYLDNILSHPGEEKYSKIRMNNKAFSEKICAVEGAVLFLEAAGFQQNLLPHGDGEEQFLVLAEDKHKNPECLEVAKELLTSAVPLKAEIDRNLQVFRSSPRVTHFDLPNEFYKLTVDEIKREQKSRSEAVEKEQVLRTRAMRERDEMKMFIKHYRFVLLRVRMPDGLILQGVFQPLEKFSTVRLVVSEVLNNPAHVFTLSAYGKLITDEDVPLAQLGLVRLSDDNVELLYLQTSMGQVPSAVLNFSWDSSSGRTPEPPYLNSDLMACIQDLI